MFYSLLGHEFADGFGSFEEFYVVSVDEDVHTTTNPARNPTNATVDV